MTTARRDRIVAISGVIAIEAALGIALLLGLRVALPASVDRAPPAVVAISLPSAPPPPPPTHRGERARDRAAPPALRARATDLVASPPVLPLPVPVLITAAPVANDGVAARSGASDLAGPGTGAGGFGDGTGGGGNGGDGDGGSRPRRIRGSLRNSDYPRAVAEAGGGGTVGVRYRVGVDGRVGECLVTASSGNADLDRQTCALIQRRFRFAPARDENGRPVPSTIVEHHTWFVEDDDGR